MMMMAHEIGPPLDTMSRIDTCSKKSAVSRTKPPVNLYCKQPKQEYLFLFHPGPQTSTS